MIDDITSDEPVEETSQDALENEVSSSSPTTINANPPSFVKDIVGKHTSVPLNTSVEVLSQNPFEMDGNAISYQSSNYGGAPKQESSFVATAEAEAYEMSPSSQFIHSRAEAYQDLGSLGEFIPQGWTPKRDVEKFENVRPEYMPYLLSSTGPIDQQFRFQKVMDEQAHDDTLANGSFLAKLVGGAIGLLDPVNLIPIAKAVKYAKLSSTFLSAATKALPGVATNAVLSAGAEQLDKANGNAIDFVENSFINAAFGTALFGAGSVIGLTADKMELWNLRKFAKNSIDGIDFKMKINEKGELKGFEAFDENGLTAEQQHGSAMKVSFAQDIANSSFAKIGLFKVPYLGTAIIKTLGNPVFGTPLIRMINSPFKAVRGFIDRVADHAFITEGIEKGQAAPKKFEFLMKKEYAGIRALEAQMNALHLERNGFSTEVRPIDGLINLGLNLKDKALKVFADDVGKTGYTTREEFDKEVQQVISEEQSSQHPQVNTAAAMMRMQMDKTYSAYRQAYNLPKDWMPTRTQRGFLTRVYNTPYMSNNQDEWVSAISKWLRDSDEVIHARMEPIKKVEEKLSKEISLKKLFNDMVNVPDHVHKKTADNIIALKAQKRALEEKLQNDLRSDEELNLHVHDWNAVSANEAKEILNHRKRVDIAQKEVDERKEIIANIKKEASKREASAIKSKTAKTAKSNTRKSETGKLVLAQEEEKLRLVQHELEEEQIKLQEKMHNGEINSRLFRKIPNSNQYELKDPKDRLRFRDTYGSRENKASHILSTEKAAKAYYDTILNQTPEDTINQIMGRYTGNASENTLKHRTLLIPDKILYDNGFLTNDLMAKVSNYTTYLSRRTHLKTVFNDVSHEGGIEPILHEINEEHERFREHLNSQKDMLKKKLSNADLDAKERKTIEKQIETVKKGLEGKRKEFETAKYDIQHIYQKMMGISNVSRKAQQLRSVIMSLTSIGSLPFVPLTMINDISAIGLQHGMWAFIRDGVYPVISSLGGIIKSKDSEALRNCAPSIHLALQDVLNAYQDKNFSMTNSPYLNLGKIVNTLEKVSHLNSNFTLTNYFDNGLQRITASVTQSEIMRILHTFAEGKMSQRDGRYIRKYGIDPEKWAPRMIAAFKKDGGGKTTLGGYSTNFWRWEDKEAANELGDAVFRGVKDTQIQQGIADSPFWTDTNSTMGILGTIIKGFNGWTFSSVNRYVIPSLQTPDAQKLLGVTFMLATGAMVDPMRRMARGDDAYPPDITDGQMLYSAISNSGYFSWFTNALADANMLTGDALLGDLKNDKYKDRTRAGLLGPAWGQANRMANIISSLATGEVNEADTLKAARMLPFANASWTYWMSRKLVESLELPKTRAQAHAMKAVNQ